MRIDPLRSGPTIVVRRMARPNKGRASRNDKQLKPVRGCYSMTAAMQVDVSKIWTGKAMSTMQGNCGGGHGMRSPQVAWERRCGGGHGDSHYCGSC